MTAGYGGRKYLQYGSRTAIHCSSENELGYFGIILALYDKLCEDCAGKTYRPLRVQVWTPRGLFGLSVEVLAPKRMRSAQAVFGFGHFGRDRSSLRAEGLVMGFRVWDLGLGMLCRFLVLCRHLVCRRSDTRLVTTR